MWYRTEFDFNVLFIHLRTRKMPFNALVFTLRSKVELNWTRAIRPVIAQSAQFNKIAKKLNIDLCQFFFSSRGSTVLITALFTNMRIVKFKSQLTIAFFAAVNHLNGPLRKQNFTLTGSKGQGL